MTDTILPALQYSVSITDAQGRPTPWFQRYWNTTLADRIGPIGDTPSPSLPSVAAATDSNASDIATLQSQNDAQQAAIEAASLTPAYRHTTARDNPDARVQRLESIVWKLMKRIDALEQTPR